MNTLLNIDPFGILDELLNTGSRSFRTARARAAGRFPPVNVYLDDNAVILDLELPGKTAKDVELTLEAQAVTITDRPAEARGEAPRVEPQARAALPRERRQGQREVHKRNPPHRTPQGGVRRSKAHSHPVTKHAPSRKDGRKEF